MLNLKEAGRLNVVDNRLMSERSTLPSIQFQDRLTTVRDELEEDL